MSRPIKFRAWDGEKMHEDFILLDPEWILKKNIGCPVNEGFKLLADNWIVMQFTGRQDKNSRDIFESDFVSWDNSIYEVRFINGCWDLFHKGDSEHDRPALHYVIKPSNSNIEVLGNVYENPELLK